MKVRYLAATKLMLAIKHLYTNLIKAGPNTEKHETLEKEIEDLEQRLNYSDKLYENVNHINPFASQFG